MENVKVKTTTTPKDMFWFQMYQMYRGYMGFILGLLLVLALADLIGNFGSMSMGTRVLCIVLLVWIIFLNPVLVYFRSKKQVEALELDKVPMELTIGQEGVLLAQGDASGLISWSEITRIVILKRMVVFYMGKRQIHLLPLGQIQEQADAVTEAIKTYGAGIKLVNKRKKRRKK